MATKKKDKIYEDAKGNTICQHPDGSSEMYVGGKASHKQWLDISDEADKAVQRKRFLPDYSRPTDDGVATRDPTSGLNFDHSDINHSKDKEAVADDD